MIYQFTQYVRAELGATLAGTNCIVRSFSQGSVVGDVQVELAAESQSVADGLAVSLSDLSTNIDQNLSANGQTLVASISAEGKSKIQPFFTSHSSLKTPYKIILYFTYKILALWFSKQIILLIVTRYLEMSSAVCNV